MKKKTAGRRKPCRISILLVILFVIAACFAYQSGTSFAAEETAQEAGRLQNGSFETFGDSRFPQTATSKYTQVIPKETDYWKTTAYEKKMQLLRENTGVYINGVKIKPRDGEIAAELKADEESSLYQVVDTEPSSIYEWYTDLFQEVPRQTEVLLSAQVTAHPLRKEQRLGTKSHREATLRHMCRTARSLPSGRRWRRKELYSGNGRRMDNHRGRGKDCIYKSP